MTDKITKIWTLYRITNLINNKIYIGQAADLSKRWSDHRRAVRLNKPTQIIHHAMIKYGIDNFLFEEIATCNSQEGANELETILVSQYNSFVKNGKGYNATLGGMNAPKSELWHQSMKEWRESLTEEEKAEINSKRSIATIQQIAEQGHPSLGKKRTDEQRAQMSFVQKNKDNAAIYTEEVRKRFSEAHLGLKDTEETKVAKSEAQKEAWIKRNAARTLTGDIRCMIDGCDIIGIGNKYRFFNSVRYCQKHAFRLKAAFEKNK